MKEHSNNFETEIKTYGRQQAVQVIFEQDGQEVVLDNENVFSVTPNFKASLLKSAMKSLILDCNVEIPVGTRLQFRYGILVNNAYEYLDFGYYIVNKIEKKEDTRSYEITCYDKMMLAMVDYIDIGINYPITIRNYINSICNHLEINFGNNEDQFINYDKEISSELYLDENGNSLNYTFRDVLDELAQVTASVICIDENDNLVVKYPQLNGEYETIEGTSLYIENADDNKIDLELQGNTTQDGTPTPDAPVEVENVTGEQVVRVCGKNRFNLQKLISFGLGNHFSALDNGIISTIPERTDWSGNTPPMTASPTLNQRETIYNYGISVTPGEQLTISFDNPNGTYAEALVFYYDKDANYLSVQSLGARNDKQYVRSFSVRANTRYIMFRFDNEDYNYGAKQLNIQNIQLETGSIATTYEPYQGKDYEINLGNIELNKIGDYQDFIRKGTGKNLYIGYENMLEGFLPINGTYPVTNSSFPNARYMLIDLKKGEKITTSGISTNTNGRARCIDAATNQVVGPVGLEQNSYFEATIGYGDGFKNGTITAKKDIIIGIMLLNNDLTGLDYFQIERGNSATYYEPYGYKDKWYIEKNVGKVVLDGINNNLVSKHTSITSETKGFYMFGLPNKILGRDGSTSYGISNYFSYIAQSSARQAFSNNTSGLWWEGSTNWNYMILEEASLSDANTWLTTHNTTIYYVLSNPTYILIENEELIEQLDRIYLQQGLNNVLVSGNLPSSLKMTYVSDLIGIDEEQLKDINVNFGEKYGPINSLVIARAADSDFIYKEDEKSVAEDGLCEVKISDNQILNGDNRTQFIDEMYNQLRGTEFYLNDFSSTGITYLDLLDYFKVKVFDNSYKCLMLNDEINITQGLQEQVFTERPKESETEYKSIAKQDKDIRKIGIIVNKVEGEITAEIIARQDTDEKVSNLTQTIGEISTTVSTTTTQVNDLETRVQTNETAISQNSDSITATISRIQKTEDDVETLETNTEDVIKQLVFGDDGLTISAKGTTSDDMKLNLTNDAIKFLYQNNAVLTINGSTIEFSNASFKKLDLGNYVWQAEDDDSLSLIYEGD